MLNNLVRKDRKGKYAVVAGGRWLSALRMLSDEGRIARDYPVAQVRGKDSDSSELSLVENTIREQVHPADEFEALRTLVDGGTALDDIAARFGVTPRVVEQRLKLARVSPAVLDAFRKAKLNLAQVMAFTICDDHARQEQVLDHLTHYNDDPTDIRATLSGEQRTRSDAISARLWELDKREEIWPVETLAVASAV